MKGRANINEQHREHDDMNNVAWRSCRPERLAMQRRWLDITRTLHAMMDDYVVMCDAYGLRDQGRNGVMGNAHAHAVWRLHRQIYRSAGNIAANIVIG